MDFAAHRDEIAVEIAAVSADESGPSRFAPRRRRDDADHRPDGDAQGSEMHDPVFDSTDAGDCSVDHVGNCPETGLDERVAAILKFDAQDFGRNRVSGLSARDGDRTGRGIGFREAIAIVRRRGLHVLRTAESTAARVESLDDDLRRRRNRQSRFESRVEGVDDFVGGEMIGLGLQGNPHIQDRASSLLLERAGAAQNLPYFK